MKIRIILASAILTGLTFGLVGCGGGEQTALEEAKPDPTADHPGPGVQPGPVQPSPVPSMPPTTSPMPETKKDEPKMEPPK